MPRPPVSGNVHRRPGPYRDMGGDTPVAYDPDTGVIYDPDAPGFYPPGFEGDPDNPGSMRRPGTPATGPPPGGRPSEGSSGTPPGRSIPIPGYPGPGHPAPPPGAFPWPGGGGYGMPGTPGQMGDYRGVGRRRGTPATGPFPMPFDPNQLPDYGPPLPPNYPGNFWPDFPSRFDQFPNLPSEEDVTRYHDEYREDGPFIDPEQMYDYETPTRADVGFDYEAGRRLADARIRDSIQRRLVDPWIDRTLMDGIGGILEGFDPNQGWPESFPATPPTEIFGVPVPGTGSPGGTRPGPPPILDPRNYPGGGFQFPSLPDIGGWIEDQFTPMPTPGAQFPPAPSMPRNIPPMGGNPMGQMPGQMPGQFPGQMPGQFQSTMQQRPMFP